MKGVISYITFIILATLHTTAKGQVRDSDSTIVKRLNDYLVSANSAYRFNGAAMIMYHGRILLSKGYGFSNMGSNSVNTTETRFPILSMTKTFTSTVILKLEDEGKLSVNDNLSKYLPDYPNGSKIKIRHLLTHSSGIYDYTSDIGIEDSLIVNNPIAKEKVINHFKDKPLDFSPGKYYRYSNSGYFLLGLIIEKVTGKPYETVVREMIFIPLGMTQSGFDFINLPREERAEGYELWTEDKVIPYKHYDSTYAYSAGNIYSTIADLGKWAEAISSRKILKPETWKEAFDKKISNYGYGWQTGVFVGKKYVKHSGGYPGFMSEFIYYPDEDLIVILLNNFGTYDQNIWSVGMGLSCIAFQLPYDNWKLRPKITLDERMLEKRVGTYDMSFMNQKSKIGIKLKDSNLYLDIDGMELPLYAENENTFFLEYFNAQLVFKNDKIIFHSHGQDGELKKK